MAVPSELQDYVRRLAGLYRSKQTFMSGIGLSESHKIGKEIHERHGHDAMVTVCDALRDVINGMAARELESTWDGIGEWRR
jgi:hypothetical protein